MLYCELKKILNDILIIYIYPILETTYNIFEPILLVISSVYVIWKTIGIIIYFIDKLRMKKYINKKFSLSKVKASDHGKSTLIKIKDISNEYIRNFPNFFGNDKAIIIGPKESRTQTVIINLNKRIIDNEKDTITKETAGKVLFALNITGEILVIIYLCKSDIHYYKKDFIILRKYKPMTNIRKFNVRKDIRDFIDVTAATSGYLYATKFQKIKFSYLYYKDRIRETVDMHPLSYLANLFSNSLK